MPMPIHVLDALQFHDVDVDYGSRIWCNNVFTNRWTFDNIIVFHLHLQFIICFRSIDGYSRKVLWLQCAYTNHHPGVIAGYFLNCVEYVGGYPLQVRTDCGTENVTVAAIQSLVTGNVQSHIYGTSPGNQRIEAWWSFYRRQHSQWWIELFEGLVEFGSYHPGHVQETECLRFCFMRLIQKELDSVRQQWNTHRIRPSAGARCPPGIPDELYYLPPLPATNQLIDIDPVLPAELLNAVECISRSCADAEFEEYLHYLCRFNNWNMPEDTDSALELYFNLLQAINWNCVIHVHFTDHL